MQSLFPNEARMKIETLLQQLQQDPTAIQFSDTMAAIDAHYHFTPTAFRNGELMNSAGQNSGSCKLFFFAHLQQLSPQQTLECFGEYYRNDVLEKPDADDHQNIRNFMRTGWPGIMFGGDALRLR